MIDFGGPQNIQTNKHNHHIACHATDDLRASATEWPSEVAVNEEYVCDAVATTPKNNNEDVFGCTNMQSLKEAV